MPSVWQEVIDVPAVAAAMKIDSTLLFVCCGELESLTDAVNEDVPVAVGRPLICPLLGFKVTPAGSEPEAME